MNKNCHFGLVPMMPRCCHWQRKARLVIYQEMFFRVLVNRKTCSSHVEVLPGLSLHCVPSFHLGLDGGGM